jgi:hypothetical protein
VIPPEVMSARLMSRLYDQALVHSPDSPKYRC